MLLVLLLLLLLLLPNYDDDEEQADALTGHSLLVPGQSGFCAFTSQLPWPRTWP